jgi:hypothetical protein
VLLKEPARGPRYVPRLNRVGEGIPARGPLYSCRYKDLKIVSGKTMWLSVQYLVGHAREKRLRNL